MASKNKEAIDVRRLRLKKGDVLVIQRGFNTTDIQAALRNAGKAAGVDFIVPVVFVDDVREIKIIHQVKNG